MKLSNGCDHRIPLTDPHHIRTPRHERRATVSESPVERQAPVLIVWEITPRMYLKISSRAVLGVHRHWIWTFQHITDCSLKFFTLQFWKKCSKWSYTWIFHTFSDTSWRSHTISLGPGIISSGVCSQRSWKDFKVEISRVLFFDSTPSVQTVS